MDKELKKKLIAQRKIIKNKLELLKDAKMVQNELFSPITRHLLYIENKLDNVNIKRNKNY